MKVVALNGSPRPNGNTKQAIEIVAGQLKKAGIEVEVIQLGGKIYTGCTACRVCRQKQNRRCAYINDGMNDIIEKVLSADGLIVGSPTYFSNVTTEVKAFIDRCGMVNRANGGLLAGKIGASVVTARRAGANFVYADVNFFFGISEMPVASSNYWNMTLANAPAGEAMKDDEGRETFEKLGANMAKLLLKK